MSVAAVRFFHSQWFRPGHGQRPWRVQGSGERATRDGFNCEREPQFRSLWCVGSPRQVPEDDPFLQNFQTWGENLVNTGYASFPALALIFDTDNPTATDIDPDHPGTLLHPENVSTAANGSNLYQVNWL